MADYDKLAKIYYDRRKRNRLDYNRDIEVPALIKLIGPVKGKIILDMGCGFGDHAEKISRKGCKHLIGFDVSKELVAFALQKNIPRTEFAVGDMNKKLPYNKSSCDVVYSGLAVHYIKNLRQLFKEAHRVLKKGGTFCFSTGHPIFNVMNQTPEHIIGVKNKNRKVIFGNYFDESSTQQDLGKDLSWVKMHNYTMETYIKTALAAGFTLVDYVDAKPVKSASYDKFRYKLTTTLPTFMLFKFKK